MTAQLLYFLIIPVISIVYQILIPILPWPMISSRREFFTRGIQEYISSLNRSTVYETYFGITSSCCIMMLVVFLYRNVFRLKLSEERLRVFSPKPLAVRIYNLTYNIKWSCKNLVLGERTIKQELDLLIKGYIRFQ